MALCFPASATHADDVETGDCEPAPIHLDIEGEPLTRTERIARMDEAFQESLARFDECQNAAAAGASPAAGAEGTSGDASGGGAAGGSIATASGGNAETPRAGESATGGASADSVAAEGIQGTEAGEPATAGASIESVAAEGIDGTEAPNGVDADDERSAGDPEQSAGVGSGAVPEDIPDPDNDSVLEAQIRRAAMGETDPRRRAELWNEYRKYKGLPPKPLPDEDGGSTDAQTSE